MSGPWPVIRCLTAGYSRSQRDYDMLVIVRRLGLIGAWIATTALAVVLANTSIQLVGGSVTDSPSLRVTALAADDQPSTTVTSVSPVSVVVAGEESVPPGTAPNPSPTEGSTPTSSPVTTPPDTSPSSTTTTTPRRTTTTVAVPVTGPFLFATSGGTVTVRCFGADAVLSGAVPRAGYSVEIESNSEGLVKVAFVNEAAGPVAVEIGCDSQVASLVDLDDGSGA